MIKNKFSILFVIIVALSTLGLVEAQDPYEGYTIFIANKDDCTFLIDMDGNVVNTWDCDVQVGYSAYMLKNGIVCRSARDPDHPLPGGGGNCGFIQKIDWDGNILWEYKYSSADYLAHHDITPMPNGNVILIAWERKTKSEAIAAGRDPEKLKEELWPDHVIEVEQTGPTSGKIVWEWHFWDHLIQDYDPQKDNYGVVEDHPELLDINFTASGNMGSGADWLHINGIDYHEELDQVVVSSHWLDEIYVIDHSTSTEEAAGHKGGRYGKGGDILYRWGNPQAYNRGTSSDRKLYVTHDAHWIQPGLPGAGDGNIMIYNNGSRRPPDNIDASSIDVITPPRDENGNYIIASDSPFGPEELSWIYIAPDPTAFYSNHLGSAQRLPNGNTLICESTKAHLFEIDSTGEIVWEYQHRQQNDIQKCHRYPYDQTGIKQKIYRKKSAFSIRNYPNPFSIATTIYFNNPKNRAQVKIYSINGKELFCKNVKQNHLKWNAKEHSSGVYIIRVKIEDEVFIRYINLL